MPREPLELPPTVARAFVRDMRAFFAGNDGDMGSAIAAAQLHSLRDYTGRLRLTDVKAMFLQMPDEH